MSELETVSKVTKGGRVNIPPNIIEVLGIEPGETYVRITIEPVKKKTENET